MSTLDELNENGYLLLKKLTPELNLSEISEQIGKVWNRSQSTKAHLLVPTNQSVSTPNTYSGNFGLGAFPLHTDLAHWREPPRYLALRCKVATLNVGTTLLDGKNVVKKCGESVLSRAIVQPRRPIQGTIPLLRLYHPSKGSCGMLRWDGLFIKPASKNGTCGFNLVKDAIASETASVVHLDAVGDTLIIDNWRMLHGRTPIPDGSEGRVIERMYLEELN